MEFKTPTFFLFLKFNAKNIYYSIIHTLKSITQDRADENNEPNIIS